MTLLICLVIVLCNSDRINQCLVIVLCNSDSFNQCLVIACVIVTLLISVY